MDFESAVKCLADMQARAAAYSHASGVMYFDSVTTAPSDTAAGRSDTYAVLSEASYNIYACDEAGEALYFLRDHQDGLDASQKRQVELLLRYREQITKIPVDEYVEYSRLTNEAEDIWHKAKATNDYKIFAPYLQKIFDTQKRFAGYTDPDKAPYDAILDGYEQGLTTATLDSLFTSMRARLVGLIKTVSASKQPDNSCIKGNFSVEAQREFSDYLMKVLCIDRTHCGIGETEHPFTINFNNKDVRITTKYHLDDFTNSMYSVIHEGGHALYELGLGDEYQRTCIAGDLSMSVHESQSRLYENCIGRSEQFITAIMPEMRRLFGLEGVSAKDLYRVINISRPSLIRIDADELTYPLHIMVRYELEKKMISGELDTNTLPEAWNAMIKDYLGIDVPDDAHGVLQDSHWSSGLVGYFPSYALGSAYASQIMHAMAKDFDPYACMSKADLLPIREWLDAKIHHDGAMKNPDGIIASCCGEPFNPDYYIDYLTEKFSALYGIK